MIDMTEEDDDALDEYFTKSEDYLLIMALTTNKTPTELIGDMVRERIAVSPH